MAVINTGLLTKGLRSEFFNRFDSTPVHYTELATRIPSNSDSETYRWLGTVPKMREWGTGRLARGLRSESYSVENLKYEATIEVDRDEIADDQTGQIRLRIGELAQRAATHKDYLLGQLLINGEMAGYNSYDGVSFFSDSHVSGESGSQDNKLTFSATDADDPTEAEFKGALKQAIATMLAFKDDRSDPMSITASGLVCAVPLAMYFTALEAANRMALRILGMQGAAEFGDTSHRIIADPVLPVDDERQLRILQMESQVLRIKSRATIAAERGVEEVEAELRKADSDAPAKLQEAAGPTGSSTQ